MKSKTIVKSILATVFVFLLFAIGMFLGSYHGYTRGYRDGQKVTNSWWIDKQSRYYDSVEVEKKRQLHRYDHL